MFLFFRIGYIYRMYADNIQLWVHTTRIAALAICYFSAFLLWMHAGRVRSRKLLALLLLVWGIYCTMPLIVSLTGCLTSGHRVLLPFALILGNLAVIVATCYIVEAVRPGWLTLRQVLIWSAPFLLVVFVYYTGLILAGESALFDVWHRCILLLTVVAYQCAMLFVFARYSTNYRRRIAQRCSNSCLFTTRIDEHKVCFEQWMRRRKPYLQATFKLTDVSEVLPVNRSYLSRLFNEGYGMSFSRVVSRYRIEEAKRLMKKHPRMVLKQLSELCGFTSPNVFHRTFVKETGMTPKQYRDMHHARRNERF